jgi:hypothetical protein
MKAMFVLLTLSVLGVETAAVNAQGKKSEVLVERDAADGSVNVVPKKCYRKGIAFTWNICPKLFQERGKPEEFYLLIYFTQRSEAAFPAFTRAEIALKVDGDVQGGEFNWTSQKGGGRYTLIPTNKDYLENLTIAHDVSVSLQLSGKSTSSDIHLDKQGLQTLQAACAAILSYSQDNSR